MAFDQLPLLRWLTITYKPDPSVRSFMDRMQHQKKDEIEVSLAVLDAAESQRYFGVPMAKRGVQPVWLRIVNRSDRAYRLNRVSIDPNCYSPHEAAAVNHFSSFKRLLGFGAVAWVFLPVLLFLPLKLIYAWRANNQMDEFFQRYGFHLRPLTPGMDQEGFVFTPLDAGSKVIHVFLLGEQDNKDFEFTIAVPGIDADYQQRQTQNPYPAEEMVECEPQELRKRLTEFPAATSNRLATRNGDPVNLAVVGEFPAVLSAFGARWDQTEIITLNTCWKTLRAFLVGGEYRYSPVSPLYLFGRSQEFALQRIRESVNERLHLRLWATPLKFRGQPVWIGQISRDIGIRFTWRTWNLTTHRIDPDVDEARDYVVEDLLAAGWLEMAAYVGGVEPCDRESPRHNLTGDPYFTDGKRAAVMVSQTRTTPTFISWT